MQSGVARFRMFAVVLAGLLVLAIGSAAADLSLPITGNVFGSVVDTAGIPRMGATVLLFDRFSRPVGRTLTNGEGHFAFASLPADSYSVRVYLASFLPAFRDHIAVKAGLDNILSVHLATLLSSIEVNYSIPNGVMSDEWKWVLRSSPATRPVTRFLPELSSSTDADDSHQPIFSSTHAMVSVRGGDSATLDDSDSDSNQSDLGTSFALSTNIFGKNQLQFNGSFAQNPGSSLPLMDLSVVYSRGEGGFREIPEVTLTLKELAVAGRSYSGPEVPTDGALPLVRDVAISVYETADVGDDVHLEYGATGESVSAFGHLSRVSPFARVTLSIGKAGEVVAIYSNGGRPSELYAHQGERDPDSDNGSNALSGMPQISNRNGALRLQRTQNYEAGYRKTVNSRTYAVSAFYEDVSNGRLSVAGDTSLLDSGDLLWDGTSKISAYNIGRYNRNGYLASADQRIGNSLDLALAYGRLGGLTANGDGVDGSPTSLNAGFLTRENHNVAAISIHAKAPVAGTQVLANYGWVADGAIVPHHTFTTQNMAVEPGLNIALKQPLPCFFGMPGHFEFIAEARNLLAQGYIPMNTPENRRLLLLQSPRAIRGGLNFIF